jgi:hypothetical protein
MAYDASSAVGSDRLHRIDGLLLAAAEHEEPLSDDGIGAPCVARTSDLIGVTTPVFGSSRNAPDTDDWFASRPPRMITARPSMSATARDAGAGSCGMAGVASRYCSG